MPIIKSKTGININYEEHGLSNSGEVLLMLMGLGAPLGAWEKHLNEYKKYFRCIAIDNRGAGKSDKPEKAGELYTTQQLADDAMSVIDAIGVDKFSVTGISMGGCVAQIIAAQNAERVKRAVITAGWAYCGNYMQEVFKMLCNTRANLSYGDFSRMFMLWLYGAEFYQESFDVIEDGIKGNIEDPAPMIKHAFEAQANACKTHDSRGILKEIKCDVLLTAGDCDIFVPLDCAEYLHDNINGSRLELFKGRAHTHHWEDLARYNKLTVDFLKG